MSLKKNKTSTRKRMRLQNDTGSLLRSRPLQALLVTVAAAQVVAVGMGKTVHADQPRTVRELAARVASTEPVGQIPALVVAAPVKMAKARVAARKTAADRKLAAAEEMALKYRQRGFKVSPSLARQIHAAAVANRIDPKVAFGLVRTESGFKNSATSPVGAIGLTQLMPATARWLQRGVTRSDLRNPEVNLRIGFRYLRGLIDKYEGDTELALTAYNRGPGTVDRVLKRGGNPDNGYAGMVMGRRNSHR
ncbi:MAG TPA: lytic transglycosylase domain-containing protein [Longimicrobium sp.]|nr:lytic transglycosylase domain-containing protein [Longimicrobium sp.]